MENNSAKNNCQGISNNSAIFSNINNYNNLNNKFISYDLFSNNSGNLNFLNLNNCNNKLNIKSNETISDDDIFCNFLVNNYNNNTSKSKFSSINGQKLNESNKFIDDKINDQINKLSNNNSNYCNLKYNNSNCFKNMFNNSKFTEIASKQDIEYSNIYANTIKSNLWDNINCIDIYKSDTIDKYKKSNKSSNISNNNKLSMDNDINTNNLVYAKTKDASTISKKKEDVVNNNDASNNTNLIKYLIKNLNNNCNKLEVCKFIDNSIKSTLNNNCNLENLDNLTNFNNKLTNNNIKQNNIIKDNYSIQKKENKCFYNSNNNNSIENKKKHDIYTNLDLNEESNL